MAPDDGTLDLFDVAAPTEPSGAEDGGGAAPAQPSPRSEGKRGRVETRVEVDPETTGTNSRDGEPEPEAPEVWTVSQVNRAVRNLLEAQLSAVWVSGEVANWKRAGSGHRYFTLKDENAQIRAVMWRSDASRLPIDPDDGMEVRVHGSLTLYEARGEYQLVVRRLEAAGDEGLWRIAFEKLRKRLEAEGLLAAERKRRVPRFPRTVGVVTSTTGAALRDILSVIRRRAPWTRVLVMGTRVQGEGSALEIAHAVRVLGRSGRVDVMIVGRGGGSIEDLWAFNEEPVVRAIAACPVPVISAVGHEVDVTLSDLVADLRAPTPSAAGEAVVVDGAAVAEYLERVPRRLATGLRGSVQRRRRAVDEGVPRLRRALQRRIEPRRSDVGVLTDRLTRAMRTALERRRRRADVLDRLARAARLSVERPRRTLSALAGRLHALSPLSTLERGYAVPLTRDGRVLRSVDHFTPGSGFVLRVVDGRVDCEAGAIHPDDDFDGP
ncbi:MAG: exodeoxyribonuclease VII large subunit [Gemmatimonadetes bacterium]|nr:exodeoxyribonuclease VII large subunit [Gemmatimonadota bacterium]NNF39578.1 exodeoxyribonuclease VII large subunit [Gemmatimonadota bacterium]